MGDYERLIVAQELVKQACGYLANMTNDELARDIAFDLNEKAEVLELGARRFRTGKKTSDWGPFHGAPSRRKRSNGNSA